MRTTTQCVETAGSASVSIVAAMAANQAQLDVWLQRTATIVAIIAGLVTIYVALRKKKRE